MRPRAIEIVLVILVGCGPSVGDAQSDEVTGSSGSSIDTSDGPGSATTTTNADSTSSPTSTSTSTASNDDGLSTDGGGPDFMTCAAADCGGTIYSCFDGADNDGDGLVDLVDPECTSICDDDEASFQTALPGDQLFDTCRLDCEFDGNSGQGDDQCVHEVECDPEDPLLIWGCEYTHPNSCPQRAPPLEPECAPFCEPFVLPGCDCFGCCTIESPDGPREIFLEGPDDCSMTNLDACSSCTSRIEECGNTCDECEICIGGIQRDACRVNSCDGGATCTSPGDCACGEVCHLGCCWPLPPG